MGCDASRCSLSVLKRLPSRGPRIVLPGHWGLDVLTPNLPLMLTLMGLLGGNSPTRRQHPEQTLLTIDGAETPPGHGEATKPSETVSTRSSHGAGV